MAHEERGLPKAVQDFLDESGILDRVGVRWSDQLVDVEHQVEQAGVHLVPLLRCPAGTYIDVDVKRLLHTGLQSVHFRVPLSVADIAGAPIGMKMLFEDLGISEFTTVRAETLVMEPNRSRHDFIFSLVPDTITQDTIGITLETRARQPVTVHGLSSRYQRPISVPLSFTPTDAFIGRASFVAYQYTPLVMTGGRHHPVFASIMAAASDWTRELVGRRGISLS